MSQLLAKYEKVKYQKFYIVRTILNITNLSQYETQKMSQLLPCTKHSNITHSAQYEQFKYMYHKFYFVRKRQRNFLSCIIIKQWNKNSFLCRKIKYYIFFLITLLCLPETEFSVNEPNSPIRIFIRHGLSHGVIFHDKSYNALNTVCLFC